MRIRLLKRANADLVAGHKFYEEQEVGVGDYFIRCLTADIQSLTVLAGSHPLRNGYRRLISARFPYAIYYLVDDDVAKVYAVIDSRRDPMRILRRLRKS